MNNKQRLPFERENLNKVERDSRKVNCVKFNTNNSLAHELTKAKVAFFLQKCGKKFLTECKFCDGSGEADVYCISDDVCYEITHSETREHALAKKYPVSEIRVIKSNKLRRCDLE